MEASASLLSLLRGGAAASEQKKAASATNGSTPGAQNGGNPWDQGPYSPPQGQAARSISSHSISLGQASKSSPSAGLLSLLNLGSPANVAASSPSDSQRGSIHSPTQIPSSQPSVENTTSQKSSTTNVVQNEADSPTPAGAHGSHPNSPSAATAVKDGEHSHTASPTAIQRQSPTVQTSNQPRSSPFTYTNPFDLLGASSRPTSSPQRAPEVGTTNRERKSSKAQTPDASQNQINVETPSQSNVESAVDGLDINNLPRANDNLQQATEAPSSDSGIRLKHRTIEINVFETNRNHISPSVLTMIPVTLIKTPLNFPSGRIVSSTKYYTYVVKGGKIRIIDSEDGSRVLLRGHYDDIVDLGFLSDLGNGQAPISKEAGSDLRGDRQFYSISKDGTCIFWELGTALEASDVEPYRVLVRICPSETNSQIVPPVVGSKFTVGGWDHGQLGRLYLASANEVLRPDFNFETPNPISKATVTYDEDGHEWFGSQGNSHIAHRLDATITAMATSFDGSVLLTGSDDGEIRLTQLNIDTTGSNAPKKQDGVRFLRGYRLKNTQSINTILLLPHGNGKITAGNDQPLSRYAIIGSHRNRVIRLWDIASGKTVQKIRFDGDEDSFNRLAYHATSQTLFVSNTTRSSIYAIHVELPSHAPEVVVLGKEEGEWVHQYDIVNADPDALSTETTSATFTWLREFPLEQTPVDFAISTGPLYGTANQQGYTEIGADDMGVNLLVVQTKSINSISFTADDLAFAKQNDTAPLGSEGVLNEWEVVTEQSLDGNHSPHNEVPVTVSAMPSSSDEKPQNTTTAPVVALPATSRTEDSSTSSTSTPQKAESSFDGSNLRAEIKRLETHLSHTLADTVKAENERHNQHLKDERNAHQAAETARLDQILKLVSQTLTKNTSRVLEQTMNSQIENKVIPALDGIITPAVEASISNAVSKSVQKQMPKLLEQSLKDNIQATLPGALARPEISELLADSIRKAIDPVIQQMINEKVNSAMIEISHKVDATLSMALASIQRMESQFASSHPSQLPQMALTPAPQHPTSTPVPAQSRPGHAKTLSQQVFQSLGPTMAAHPYGHQQYGGYQQQQQPPYHHPALPPPVRHTPAPQQPPALQSQQHLPPPQPIPEASAPPASMYQPVHPKIDPLLARGDFEEAFTAALSADYTDPFVLVNLCRSVDPRLVFLPPGPNTPTRAMLSQPVILSLLYQLSSKLDDPATYQTRLQWMVRAVSFLEPRDGVITEYATRIVPMVLDRSRATYQQWQQEKQQSADLIDLNAVIGILQSKMDAIF